MRIFIEVSESECVLMGYGESNSGLNQVIQKMFGRLGLHLSFVKRWIEGLEPFIFHARAAYA